MPLGPSESESGLAAELRTHHSLVFGTRDDDALDTVIGAAAHALWIVNQPKLSGMDAEPDFINVGHQLEIEP